MMAATSMLEDRSVEPLAQICREDPQERRFDALVKLWVDREINYSFLMQSFPDYQASMASKLLKLLASKF